MNNNCRQAIFNLNLAKILYEYFFLLEKTSIFDSFSSSTNVLSTFIYFVYTIVDKELNFSLNP